MVKDARGLSWKEFSPRSQWKHSQLKEAKHSPPHIHSLWTEASSPCWGTTGDRHIMSPHCQTAQCCWPPTTLIYKCGLKTCLTHSHHSSRSVLIKLTADKPKRDQPLDLCGLMKAKITNLFPNSPQVSHTHKKQNKTKNIEGEGKNFQ